MKIYPVIHFLNRPTAMAEAELALRAGANGVFLISHRGNDDELVRVAQNVRRVFPQLEVGINLLTRHAAEAAEVAGRWGLQNVWADSMGVSSSGLDQTGIELSAMAAASPNIGFFASVAFKYQPAEANPDQAARHALAAGFIPTTSGTATGSAPDLQKVIGMATATAGILGVASGLTPENLPQYHPYLSHALVATGIAKDEHRMDPEKLRFFIAAARQGTTVASGV